jgi:hypothetical protein
LMFSQERPLGIITAEESRPEIVGVRSWNWSASPLSSKQID